MEHVLNDKEIESMKKFIIELKNKVRSSGRTNVIHINEVDHLFVKYKINVCKLEKNVRT